MDRGRVSVAAYFSVLGMVCAGMASAIPEIKESLGLDDAQLGLVMLAGPVGTAVSYIFVRRLVSRDGGRTGAVAGSACYLLALVGLGACLLLKPPLPFWLLAMALVPAFGNILNISANTQGGLVERRLGKSAMGFFHGNWSLANLACGTVLLGVASCGLHIGWRLAGIALLCAPLVLAASGGLEAGEQSGGEGRPGKARSRPDASLVRLGLAALLFLGCEAAVFDWIGVFYKDVLKVVPGLTMLGYCALMATMTLGRFVTDRIVNAKSPTFVVRLYTALVSLGLWLAVVSSEFAPEGAVRLACATAAFAAAGFGLSGLAPLVYSAASRSKSLPPAEAVTAVSSIGFVAYFIVPPLVGAVSKACGLGVAFAACGTVILLGSLVRMR